MTKTFLHESATGTHHGTTAGRDHDRTPGCSAPSPAHRRLTILATFPRRPPPSPPAAAPDARDFLSGLDQETSYYQQAAYASSTLQTASVALKTYAAYCWLANDYPDPTTGITDIQLCRYITWLARTLSATTIDNYISMGVRPEAPRRPRMAMEAAGKTPFCACSAPRHRQT